jgi:diaminopropionate ammonia-lyase
MDDTPRGGEPLAWLARPGARSWACAVPDRVRSGAVRDYHAGLPGYAPTPLTEVPALAQELGAGRVFVKDESARLGLPAFKVLGASWAVYQLLAAASPGEPAPPGESAAPGGPAAAAPDVLARLRDLAARRPDLVFVTATDGNHGRALARMARLAGAPARVFVPAVTGPATRAAIAGEGATVTEVAGTYDEAVAAARRWSLEHPGAALVQDTAWPGYEQVPTWIVEGYSTLFTELDTQLTAAVPALVVVPVGVGSLLQAAVMHYRAYTGQDEVTTEGCLGRGQNSAPKEPSPVTAVLAVEPDTAACLLASLRAGRPVSIPTANTIMAGLNCGTVSSAAWPYLSAGLDAAIAVPDNAARRAAADLRAAGISSGPSGAASLAGARAALTAPGSQTRRESLAIHPGSVIVLLNTEAAPAG